MIAVTKEQLETVRSCVLDLSCTAGTWDSIERAAFSRIAEVLDEVIDELKPTELERRVAELEARLELVYSYVDHPGNWGTYDNRRLLLRKMLDGSITEWSV